MRRTVFALALAAAAPLAALAAPAPATSGSAPTADASRACSIRGQQDELGTTYVYELRVKGTSCTNGKRLVRAYHACRRRHGGRDGRCSGVLRYRCSERRLNVIPSQYDARARCKRSGGAREVFHRYTQNT